MCFDGVSFRAATRKGAKLLYDKEHLVEMISGRFEREVDPLHGGYVVYGTFPKYHYESPLFTSLKEARSHRESMGGTYLSIKRVTADGFLLASHVPVSEDDPGSFDTWEALAKSRLFGLIQSRMYSGA